MIQNLGIHSKEEKKKMDVPQWKRKITEKAVQEAHFYVVILFSFPSFRSNSSPN